MGYDKKFDKYIHSKESCSGNCPFHNPSNHKLKNSPIHIRFDKSGLVERICEHSIGHDDPDSVEYFKDHGQNWAGVHGCDGCCSQNEFRVIGNDAVKNVLDRIFEEDTSYSEAKNLVERLIKKETNKTKIETEREMKESFECYLMKISYEIEELRDFLDEK